MSCRWNQRQLLFAKIEYKFYNSKMLKKIQITIIPGIVGGIFCLIGATMLLLPHSNLQNTVTGGKSSSECSVIGKIPSAVEKWCKWINEYAADWEVDPILIAAIIQQESGGDPSAISKNGAVGLMQIMPGDGKALAFECISGPCFSGRPPTKFLLNPEYNISYGTELIAGLLETTGNLRDALRAYGPIEVGYVYADRVISLMEHYK
jgi:hypothetical protein